MIFRDDYGVDELIDVIEGNRKYVKCLYVYNKIDTVCIEDVDRLARLPHSTVCSIRLNLNVDTVLELIWEYMGLLRIYTKRRAEPPSFDEPVVLSPSRRSRRTCWRSLTMRWCGEPARSTARSIVGWRMYWRMRM